MRDFIRYMIEKMEHPTGFLLGLKISAVIFVVWFGGCLVVCLYQDYVSKKRKGY